MIKWMLTTIILILTVAVVTIVMESPSLRAKAQKIIQPKTELMAKRFNEVKGILANKEGLKKFFKEESKNALNEAEKGLKEGEKEIKPLVKDVAGTDPGEAATEKKEAKPEAITPAETQGATVKPAADQIPQSDRDKLEQILEKANKKPEKKK
jgi:hypothetical protein